MSAAPEISIEERIEAVRNGEVSDNDLPAMITEIQKAIETQRRKERDIERIANERREFVVERRIDSVFEDTRYP